MPDFKGIVIYCHKKRVLHCCGVECDRAMYAIIDTGFSN